MAGQWLTAPGPNTRLYREQRRQRLAAARERGTHTVLEWSVLQGIFGDRCVKCDAEKTVKDHIVPLHQGGSDAIDNLQPLCSFCNTGKGREAVDFRSKAYPRWHEHFEEVMTSIGERWP